MGKAEGDEALESRRKRPRNLRSLRRACRRCLFGVWIVSWHRVNDESDNVQELPRGVAHEMIPAP